MENKTFKEILNCSLEELIKIKEECHNYFYNYQNICNLFGPSWDKDLIYFEENREECLIFHKYNLPFLNELLEQIRSISKERILK